MLSLAQREVGSEEASMFLFYLDLDFKTRGLSAKKRFGIGHADLREAKICHVS